MSKANHYVDTLADLPRPRWDSYLQAESHLPGPRANLELVWAAAELASEEQVKAWLAVDRPDLGTNHPQVFLTVCAVVALGRFIAEKAEAGAGPGVGAEAGDNRWLDTLRAFASDTRWRVREAAAMGLQRIGDADRSLMFRIAEDWATGATGATGATRAEGAEEVKGNLLEARAAAAGIAEPRLLKEPDHATKAVGVLDSATKQMAATVDRGSEEFRVLKQALSYCWSVVVAAYPLEGKRAMEVWLASADADVKRAMKENLKKARLLRAAPEWAVRWLQES